MQQRRVRMLVTAGPTREYVDRVRYLSNESSGRMGFALAAAALRRGHRVTLVHGPVALPPPYGTRCVPVVSAKEMLAACEREWPAHDVLIMAAAVADYTPASTLPFKRKKTAEPVSVRLVPTVDILSRLAAARVEGQVVIGFALEDRAPRRHAQDKLRRKRLDAIVLNRPEAMSSAASTVELLIAGGGWQTFSGPKHATARRLLRAIERIAARAADQFTPPRARRGKRPLPDGRGSAGRGHSAAGRGRGSAGRGHSAAGRGRGSETTPRIQRRRASRRSPVRP